MGIGVVSLVTSQKKEQSGPPFIATSAHNGTSIDGAGIIVLGNDVAQAGSPARLVNDREIITEDALFNLLALVLDSGSNLVTTRLDGISVLVSGSANTLPVIQANGGVGSTVTVAATAAGASTANITATAGAGGFATLTVVSGSDAFQIRPSGFGTIDFIINFGLQPWQIYTATGNTQIGPTLVATNAAALQVSGSLTNRLFFSGKGAGTYNVDRDLDSSKIFTNSAANTFQFPSMAGANARVGFIFRMSVASAAGTTLKADAADVIRFGSLVTVAGGTLTSVDVGANVVLVYLAGRWVTESFCGAWVVT